MKFDVAEFKAFCSDLKIDTKEKGICSLGEAWSGTQEYFLQELAAGLAEGIHYFVVLKGRQVMITTICLALDLYWASKYSGMQGTLITDTEENRDMFRETLGLYLESLPRKWKQRVLRHNRTQLIMGNRSRFMYQVAGTKRKEKRSVGVGKAVMMAHGTECSNWGDDGALPDIHASLAKINPRRLYIWESTARGPNGFQDMWENAQMAYEASKTQKAIFIGWWRNALYVKKKGSAEYNVYWDGHINAEELAWVEEVKQLYDYDITDEQLAWWRYTLSEEQFEQTKMYENYPPTESYAFQMSGSQFFTSGVLSDRMTLARGLSFDAYRFVMGESFADCELVPADPRTSTLKIWEHPKGGAVYAIGADPAYGSSAWADRFCVQVYRVYAEGMEQVAEFATEHCTTYQFAWVTLYLAGAFYPCMMNLEVNGPGMAVWQEMQNMKRLAGTAAERINSGMLEVIANVQNYLYRRPDSLQGAYNFHTKTTTIEKERFMNAFRDGLERGIIKARSIELLRECKNVVRDDGELGAPGRGKDDRVIASGLATIAWTDFLRIQCASRGITRAQSAESDRTGRASVNPVARSVQSWLKQMGLSDEQHRSPVGR